MNFNSAISQDQLYRKPLTIFEAMTKNITPDLSEDIFELNKEGEQSLDLPENELNRDYLFSLKMIF